MRLSRKIGLLATSKLPTLYELFSAATVVASNGTVSTSQGAAYITISGDTSDPVWVISCTGNGIAFVKVKNRAVTYLKTAVTSSNPSSTDVTAAASGANTQITSGSAYGRSILAIRFLDFSEAKVDATLSKMSAEILAGRNSGTASTLSTLASGITGTQQHLYLQMFARPMTGCGLSLVSGDAPTTPIISRSGTGAGTLAYWRLDNNYYYLSANGTNNVSVLGGTICHLS